MKACWKHNSLVNLVREPCFYFITFSLPFLHYFSKVDCWWELVILNLKEGEKNLNLSFLWRQDSKYSCKNIKQKTRDIKYSTLQEQIWDWKKKKATHSLNFLPAGHTTPYTLLNATGNIIYIKWGRSQQKFVLAPGKTITLMCAFESMVAPRYGVNV